MSEAAPYLKHTRNSLPGMQPHAHAHLPAVEPGLRRQRALRLHRRQRVGGMLIGAAKHDEDTVALGVDLDAVVLGPGLALQELGAPLDVVKRKVIVPVGSASSTM